jgi:hypothetical protein
MKSNWSVSKVHRPLALLLVLVLAAGGALSGCGARQEHEVAMAPLEHMPHNVQQADVRVQQAYQFAVANREVAEAVPCYCGCGPLGHTSSYDCYVRSEGADGVIEFDDHAVLCTICIDITQDTIRLMREGKSAQQIRIYVENHYSRFGPTNMSQVP